MTQSLAQITLVVPDYESGIAFYCGSLGFTLMSDEDLGNDKRWVVVRPKGDQGAGLLLARAVGERQTAAIGNQTGGRVAFFLQTDDFDTDHSQMITAGVEFLEAPRLEPYGKVAKFRDPFGNLWDLLQPSDQA